MTVTPADSRLSRRGSPSTSARWRCCMPHHIRHLITSVAALAATLVTISLTPNALVKRKLRLSVFLFAAYLVLHVVLFVRPQVVPANLDDQLRSFEQLALAAALHQPARRRPHQPAAQRSRPRSRSRRSSRTRSSSASLVLVATFVFDDKLLTTSAVGAVVVGFALQDTLGNAFAGLAIQSEKPFRVGALDPGRRVRGARRRGHLARDQAAHQVRQLRHPPEQHRREGSDHELLGAGGADAARGRGRRELPDARPTR